MSIEYKILPVRHTSHFISARRPMVTGRKMEGGGGGLTPQMWEGGVGYLFRGNKRGLIFRPCQELQHLKSVKAL